MSKDPSPAQIIGHYSLIEELGRGGQGTVWLAEDQKLKRKVALKLLQAAPGVTEGRLARFRREAEAASKLDHPNICGLLDAGEVDGTPYLAFRYVGGETLAERITRAFERQEGCVASEDAVAADPDPSSSQGIDRIVALFEKTARALHKAHEQGLIHRDVKPSNLMVTPDGEPIVLDFGLARDELAEEQSLTHSGDLLGTPAYMSPEQLVAQRIPLDRRTDVYSLGASLYEALTLQKPYAASTRAELYQKILASDPSSASALNRQIPRDLQVVLEVAMEKDRNRRYQTALDFAEDLRRFREHESVQAKPIGAWLKTLRWVQRHPVRATALAALMLAFAITSWFLLRAERALRHTRAIALAARSVQIIESDPMVGLLLAREAVRLEPENPEILSQLHTAYASVRECQVFRHHARVWFAVFADGDKSVITGDHNGNVARWTLDGRLSRRYQGPSAKIIALDASSDGELLLAVQSDNDKVWIWEVETGIVRRPLEHMGAVNSATFSPSGRLILTACDDGIARLWDVREDEPILERGHDGPVVAAAFSGDKRFWTVARSVVRLWAVDGSLLGTFRHEAEVQEVDVSPDGEHVATVSHRTGTVWSVHGDNVVRKFPRATRLRFVGEGDQIIAVRNGAGWLYKLSGSLVDVIRPAGHKLWVSPVHRQMVFTLGSGVRVLSGEGAVQSALLGHQNEVMGVEFSSDGTQALSASLDHTARLWDSFSPDMPECFVRSLSGSAWGSVQFTADGRILAAAGFGGPALMWTPTTGGLDVIGGPELVGFRAALDPGDSFAVTVGSRQQLPRICGLHRDEVIELRDPGQPQTNQEAQAWCASVDPITGNVVTGYWDGKVRIWKPRGELIHALQVAPEEAIVQSAVLRGDRLLTASSDRSILLWTIDLHTKDQDLATEFKGHTERAYHAEFSPDGMLVLTCSPDTTARLWSLDGALLQEFSGHTDFVRQAHFAPESQRVITASGDGTARVWGLDGKELFRLQSLAPLCDAAFSRDEEHIATLDMSGRLRVWIAKPEVLIQRADARLARRQFLVGELEPYAELLGSRFAELMADSRKEALLQESK